ncbi:MAG: hypothetical protein KBT12_04830 [Bacteroidales bacterium]|nr:hypothetical protein [Candidatus Physcousia equi]
MKKYIVPQTTVTPVECDYIISTSAFVQRGDLAIEPLPSEEDRTFVDDAFTGIWGE